VTGEAAVAAGGEPLLVSHLLTGAGLASSLSQARRLIKAGAIRKNEVKVPPPDAVIFRSDLFYGKYLLLRRGKHHPAVARLEGLAWQQGAVIACGEQLILVHPDGTMTVISCRS
jgi:hypothetical protein